MLMLHQLIIKKDLKILLSIMRIKKKKVTKLSVISNNKGFILSIVPFDINKTLSNDKTKTAVHDVKIIESSINNVTQIKNDSKNYYLMGDKSYKN
jgi:hypothetical protein